MSVEREVFPRLVGDGLYGMRRGGHWLDIGTPESATWPRTCERMPAGGLIDPSASVEPRTPR